MKTAISAGLVYGGNWPELGNEKASPNLLLHLLLLVSAADLLWLVGNSNTIHRSVFSSTGLFLEIPDPGSQIFDMVISAIWAETVQGFFQAQEIIFVWSTWTDTLLYMLGELLRRLRTDELVVFRSPNIYQGLYRRRSIAWIEGGVMYGVAVYLTNVEVLPNFGNSGSFYSIGGTPYFVRRRVVMICQCLPE